MSAHKTLALDLDYARCLDSKKSTSNYFQFVGGAISWSSKLKKCTMTSTIEAKYVATSDVTKEALSLN